MSEEILKKEKIEVAPKGIKPKKSDGFRLMSRLYGKSEDESRILWEKMLSNWSIPISAGLVNGKIVEKNDQVAFVNITRGIDAVLPFSDNRVLEKKEKGEEVKIFVTRTENRKGEVEASTKEAIYLETWFLLEKAHQEKTVVYGIFKKKVKGGLILNINGVETFLPGSHMGKYAFNQLPTQDEKIPVLVLNINRFKKNIIVSHRAIVEQEHDRQVEELFSSIEIGQVVECTVKNTASFGVFAEIGTTGIVGLIFAGEMTLSRRIEKPDEVKDDEGNLVFLEGAKLEVVIIGFDKGKQQVSLSRKALLKNPWDDFPEDIQKGSLVVGKVIKVIAYGAFLEVHKIEAFIHISELSYSSFTRNAEELLEEGDEVKCVVLDINREPLKQELYLSIKATKVHPTEQEDFSIKYALGTVHDAIVRRFFDKSVLMELEEGLEGFLEREHLSWLKKISSPRSVLKMGEKIKVMVIGVEERRERKILQLSKREVESENPWNHFKDIFVVGSQHTGVVSKKVQNGWIVSFTHGLESLVYNKDIQKKDGSDLKESETLPFIVLDFNFNFEKIIFSHLATYDTKVLSKEKKEFAKKGKKEALKQATLGDFGNLRELEVLDEE